MKSLRESLGVSQALFAQLTGVSPRLVHMGVRMKSCPAGAGAARQDQTRPGRLYEVDNEATESGRGVIGGVERRAIVSRRRLTPTLPQRQTLFELVSLIDALQILQQIPCLPYSIGDVGAKPDYTRVCWRSMPRRAARPGRYSSPTSRKRTRGRPADCEDGLYCGLLRVMDDF